jgi:hypothetical protein
MLRGCIKVTSHHHVTSHHITSHHITSHRITSRHVTSRQVISHLVTSHHITSHHITSQYISLHLITSIVIRPLFSPHHTSHLCPKSTSAYHACAHPYHFFHLSFHPSIVASSAIRLHRRNRYGQRIVSVFSY